MYFTSGLVYSVGSVHKSGHPAKAAVAVIVAAEKHLVVAVPAYGNGVVRIAFIRREIKYEKQLVLAVASFKGQHSVAVVHPG